MRRALRGVELRESSAFSDIHKRGESVDKLPSGNSVIGRMRFLEFSRST